MPVYDDVQRLTAARLANDGIAVDVICGGFPCQDISLAGKGAGLDGERSGLWSEYARLIGELRPRYAIIENVSILRARGLDQVLGQLNSLGYDAEWNCIPACAVGAPHQRDRIWIVAYPRGEQHEGCGNENQRPGAAQLPQADQMADASRQLLDRSGAVAQQARRLEPANGREDLAYADSSRLSFPWTTGETSGTDGCPRAATHGARWWSVEPNVGRVAHGVPSRVDRLKCLGNAVVPQVVELIGHAILAHHRSQKEAA